MVGKCDECGHLPFIGECLARPWPSPMRRTSILSSKRQQEGFDFVNSPFAIRHAVDLAMSIKLGKLKESDGDSIYNLLAVSNDLNTLNVCQLLSYPFGFVLGPYAASVNLSISTCTVSRRI